MIQTNEALEKNAAMLLYVIIWDLFYCKDVNKKY